MMRTVIGGAVVALALTFANVGIAQQEDSFPHARHAKLFPSCTGCHAGTATSGAPLYPDAATCNGCHDGQQTSEGRVLRRVRWPGAAKYAAANNLTFPHLTHAQDTHTERDTRACMRCHQQQGTTEWMAVVPARPEACLTCHAHAAPTHLAEVANCRTCHVPLAQATQLTAQRIAAFPKPDSHAAPDFLSAHAPMDATAVSRCAICHTQQSCARCHMNASTTASITALGSNPTVAQALTHKAAAYPVPASHADPQFAQSHREAANAPNATCGNCHSRASCQVCHLQIGARGAIARLPVPQSTGPQGVQLRRAGPKDLLYTVSFRQPATPSPTVALVRVHPPDFMQDHRAAASTSAANCGSCHIKRYCADCHDGVGRVRYHPPNFVQGHAAQSYGREQDCASCHNTEAFCVSCHQSTGIGAKGVRSQATHNQSPNWLIDHGQAARLELASCTSCHKQSDCIQCHSTTTWSVNPHGPNFNASLMASRNSQICYYCHVTIPTGH